MSDIVLVEDDRSLLRAWETLLSQAGHHVRAAASFEEARQQLVRQIPDLLITDIRLGSFNGLQLVLRAKTVAPDLPALVVTGFHDPVLRREATTIGAVYLEKPLDGGALLKAVDGLLSRVHPKLPDG